jgi:predicted NBD/HSP70 family sugar kinase
MNVYDIKQNNCKRIYDLLREQGAATKQEMAYKLQLSLPTVTQNLNTLVDEGLVSRETRVMNRGGGRNPVAYTYRPDARVAIGLDITRHHVKSIVIDLSGNVIKYVYHRKDYQRSDEYLRMLGSEVEAIIEMAKLDRSRILGVGIAMPGLVDRTGEYIVDGRVIDNNGLTRAELARYIAYPVKLIHDSAAAGFAEITRSPDIHNACYVSLGSSIGGSVFINDKVYLGDGLYSSEFGHLNLIPDGRRCYCGQRGCFDPYCNSEVLSSLTGGDLFTFFEQLEQGDDRLRQAWGTYLNHLATLVTEIRMMFGSSIIIGGDIGVFIDKYLPVLQSKVDARSPFGEKSDSYLYACRNKMEAIATGAALYFVQEFLDNAFTGSDKTDTEATGSKGDTHYGF